MAVSFFGLAPREIMLENACPCAGSFSQSFRYGCDWLGAPLRGLRRSWHRSPAARDAFSAPGRIRVGRGLDSPRPRLARGRGVPAWVLGGTRGCTRTRASVSGAATDLAPN